MNIPHKQLSVDINRKNQFTVDFIGHVNDKDVRYIDVTFNAGGTPITLEEGCTATVTYVSKGVLIDQAADCTVSGSTVVIGVDSEKVENLRSGILEVQPKVVDPNGRVLTMQIPILVRISPDIAEHGQVDDDSLGSYAEVVREIAAARGRYQSLSERLANTAAPTDEQVNEAVGDYLDEHPDVFAYATPEQYGAVGDGVTDDTAAINRCIEENQFIIFSKTYAIDPRAHARAGSGEAVKYGISVPSNRILKFLKHSKVICKDELSYALSYWSRGFDLFEVENVIIDGLTLICDRSIENETISGTPVAKGHGVRVSGSKNVTIKNCDISNAYGDGLSVWISGVESSQDPAQRKLCENILIENCTIHENRRNGMTLGGSKNITVSNCKFLNNGNKVVYEGGVVRWGLPPRAGVDIEPNYDHVPVENVAFNNCIFDGNASYDADAEISGSNAPGGYNNRVEFDDAIMENPTSQNIENIRTYRKNLSLNSCAIGSAKLRASDVTVEGGKYGFLFIGTAPSKANVFGATIFKVSSGGEQGAANFCGCDFIGNGSDQIFIVNGNDSNSWKGMTLYSCRLVDTKVGMAKTGHLVLNDCFIYQKAGAFSSHGHIHANNTEFHFEDHSNDSIALMTVTSLELKSCDFHYNPENSNLRFFAQAKGAYSGYYTYYTWFNNRFHNALPDNINLNVIGNSLVKNFFNFASAKITNSVTGQTIDKIGNIYSDVKEFQSLINSSHKLSSDLIDDSNGTNKFVTSSEKTTWNGKYEKPSGGIPATDLASGVIPTVPTKVSELNNDSGFLTLSTLPIYSGGVQ